LKVLNDRERRGLRDTVTRGPHPVPPPVSGGGYVRAEPVAIAHLSAGAGRAGCCPPACSRGRPSRVRRPPPSRALCNRGFQRTVPWCEKSFFVSGRRASDGSHAWSRPAGPTAPAEHPRRQRVSGRVDTDTAVSGRVPAAARSLRDLNGQAGARV
jgi:hypothetical protein